MANTIFPLTVAHTPFWDLDTCSMMHSFSFSLFEDHKLIFMSVLSINLYAIYSCFFLTVFPLFYSKILAKIFHLDILIVAPLKNWSKHLVLQLSGGTVN